MLLQGSGGIFLHDACPYHREGLSHEGSLITVMTKFPTMAITFVLMQSSLHSSFHDYILHYYE